MYLYGENGPQGGYIKYVYDKTSPSIDIRLVAGTYYLRLYDSGYYGPYELKVEYTPD